MSTARVAAIDCGTNSLRLLVADVDPAAGRLTDVDRRMEIVRLGQGVDSTGRLAPEALERTLRALAGYARIIRDLSVGAVRMVATSATRDAANADDFVRGVKGILGLEPEVLSGMDEAYLSFTGATAEFVAPGGSAGPGSGPCLVVDIGGGSTEFVIGEAGASGAGYRGPGGVSAVSVDIGCVRLTERHLHSDPPRPDEVRAAAADIGAALDTVAAAIPVADARTLVGLAGSVTTVAGLALGLREYDSARIHHTRVTADQVSAQARRLLGQTRAERAALGVMHPGRADVIAGGAMVLDQIMRRFGFAEVLASEHDILDGIAWALGIGVSLRSAEPGPAAPGSGWPGDPATPDTPVAHDPAGVRALAAEAGTLAELLARESVCRACPRLVEWREEVARVKRRAHLTEPYWGRPIAGWGDDQPRILIAGLAPAAHGGNRTGRVFTGDRSGDVLFASLYRCGLAAQPDSVRAGDGQRLLHTWVAAAVRCAPPANKPTVTERDTCAPWLTREIGFLTGSLRVIVCLGGYAWQALWPVLGDTGFTVPRPRPRFGHGVEVTLGSAVPGQDVVLMGCYHPSQQNTFTGRVTPGMLDAVFQRARGLAGLGEVPGPSHAR